MIFVATQNRMATAKYTRRVMLISFFDTMSQSTKSRQRYKCYYY